MSRWALGSSSCIQGDEVLPWVGNVIQVEYRLCRAFGEAGSTVDAFLGGTIGFAAPEQISPAFGAISPKTDIYAVGGLVYWFFTGKAPHSAENVGSAVADTISPHDVDNSMVAQSPQALYRTLAMALRKLPSERQLV